ncbi:MAG: pentapeptide repeat-containing protein [Flavobacterium sp.]|nr:pentapeptide repeat-containing protein [Flavobacterium sp.]
MNTDYLLDQKFSDVFYLESDIKFKEYENCTFTNCDFTDCTFQTVTFLDCIFFDCNFKNTKINYVSLRGVVFTKCDFTAVNFAMTDQVIYDFHFTDCLLDYAQFYALKLKKMRFINCSMVAVDFMKTDLTEVLFDNCNLRLAVFSETIALKTDFSTSYNYTIDPEKNKIKKAQFSLEGVKGLLTKYDIVIK